MAIEKTYIMLKPDCIKRRLMGAVISRIENKGYLIIEAKMINLDEAKIREHYPHLTDRDFCPELVEYMTSGPVLAMIIEGENVISGMRMLLGPTKIENAAAERYAVILPSAPQQILYTRRTAPRPLKMK